MTRQRSVVSDEKGLALAYTAVMMTGLLLFTGLAVDTGRAYMVKAQLSKAVDGAALAAARNLNSGNPEQEAIQIFRANFPAGYMGTSSVTDPTTDADFFTLETIPATGVNVITVQAEAVLPTTFMRLANFDTVSVSSSGEATRRMVDLSLVLDVSSSIGPSRWAAVESAAEMFVNAFDEDSDRLSLVFFSNGARVIRPMPSSRGFNKTAMINAIPSTLPGGSTNMVEGLYRGWDELRSVPGGQQSGLRVIVLFTDGASNSVPARWNGLSARALRTFDFPDNGADPDNQTHYRPSITGYYNPETGATVTPPNGFSQDYIWNSTNTHGSAPWMPPNSFHAFHRSAGIRTTFPLQTNALQVNGTAQSTRRGLRQWNPAGNGGLGAYPAQIWNINNAARNLVEIISNDVRDDDDGDYPIRIYTIGMGELVQYDLGTIPETPESILMRIANDPASPDHNTQQLDGKYYFALAGADVGPAFQALQAQIIRLTK